MSAFVNIIDRFTVRTLSKMFNHRMKKVQYTIQDVAEITLWWNWRKKKKTEFYSDIEAWYSMHIYC